MTLGGSLAEAGRPARSVDPGLAAWLACGAVVALCFVLRDNLPWLVKFPDALVVPVVVWVNAFMDWFVENFRWFFAAISWLLGWPMTWLQALLQWLPWPATVAIFVVLAHEAGGRRLAVFTLLALLYMVIVGYWRESMNTLALVGVSVPLAVALGFGLGVWGFRSRRAERVIQPCLDLMQTVPTFAYLIPILLLFGFGPVVGLIASAIYACPPMVRNVMHGLRRIPSDIVESGQMCGATRRQRFWWVEVPTALPQIMVGVNQTTMAGLSMVIIAAIIGGSDDIGWEVLSTMRKAQFGQSLLAGVVIALIAMIMDRISWGFTDRSHFLKSAELSLWRRHGHLLAALAFLVLMLPLAQLVPALKSYPKAWVFYPAAPLNDGLTYVTVNFAALMDAVKNTTLFFFMLPIRIGLEKAVSPFSWGFALTPLMSIGYAILIAWQTGGWTVALFSLLGSLFILLTGVWQQAMLSVYLCGAAVIISFVLGGLLGIWAAGNDRVSAVLRPINDTLQTMPQFVFLIPVLMFFQVGEFSALLAIIAYAIVPIIRYTEHGIRHIRPDILEAAESMGCTRRQMLWQVKLPLALPEIMLGLNQTIMYGLAMLVIAALVGTSGLGQLVYIALGKADVGKGLVAGLSMALVAMITDRIIQAWSARKKAALGLA